MREPARHDPSPRPLVALPSSRKPGMLDRLAGRLRRRGSEQDDHLRAELERLRIVQRQLENAQLYLTAATQVPIEAGFITKRAARLERDVQTLIQIVARYRL
jgi:hypothetical protein